MSAPKRIQLRRTKGYRKPEGAIVVARPSKWGNPFPINEWVEADDPLFPYLVVPGESDNMLAGLVRVRVGRARAIECHGWWLIQQPILMLSLHELRGHDLACWCPLDQPCHADILLELANGEAS